MIPRRLGLLTAVVAVAATLPLPSAYADASAGTESTLTLEDRNGDAQFGLYTATGTLVPESDSTSVVELTTRGGLIVTVEDTYAPSNDLHERVVARDLKGHLLRVLDDVFSPAESPDSTFDTSPSISPDGSTVLWSQITLTGTSATTYDLRTAPVASGASTVLPGSASLAFAAYLDDTTLLAMDQSVGHLVSLPATGGAATSVSSTLSANSFTVSHDGTRLAWSADTPGGGADIQVASFTDTGGTVTLGTVGTLTSTGYNTSPAWSADDATIRFISTDGNVDSPGDVWTVSSDPSSAAPAPVLTTPADELAVATALADPTPPAAATAQPFTLNGTSVGLSWTLPADPDLAGVIITRAPAAAPIFVAAPGTSYTVSNLPLNTLFSYTFTAVDRSGNPAASSPTASRSVTALRPNPSFPDPTSAVTSTAPFPVTFGSGLPAGTRFTVDVSAGGGAFTRWVSGLSGSKRPFGLASSGAASTTSVPGASYRFRVSVTDAYGNSGSAVTTGSAVVPYDHTKATFSKGAYTYRSADRWLGSVAVLPSAGVQARVVLTGNRLQVIGDRCPTCGVMDVYVGSTKVGSVDTYAKKRAIRQVLFTQTYSTTATRTITVRARGTAHRSSVIVDAFAMRR
jgi:hypothetical protein